MEIVRSWNAGSARDAARHRTYMCWLIVKCRRDGEGEGLKRYALARSSAWRSVEVIGLPVRRARLSMRILVLAMILNDTHKTLKRQQILIDSHGAHRRTDTKTKRQKDTQTTILVNLGENVTFKCVHHPLINRFRCLHTASSNSTSTANTVVPARQKSRCEEGLELEGSPNCDRTGQSASCRESNLVS